MSIYKTYTELPENNRDCAVAIFELSALPGQTFRLCINALTLDGKRSITAMLTPGITNNLVEGIFTVPAWLQYSDDVSCDAQLVPLMCAEAFQLQVLEPMAQYVAAVTGRAYLSTKEVAAVANKVIYDAMKR